MFNFSSATSVLKYDDNHKLQNISYLETIQIIVILNRRNCWLELAAVLTHPDSKKPMFNSDDIGYVFFIFFIRVTPCYSFSSGPRGNAELYIIDIRL